MAQCEVQQVAGNHTVIHGNTKIPLGTPGRFARADGARPCGSADVE